VAVRRVLLRLVVANNRPAKAASTFRNRAMAMATPTRKVSRPHLSLVSIARR
jgi:hypothetical protein